MQTSKRPDPRVLLVPVAAVPIGAVATFGGTGPMIVAAVAVLAMSAPMMAWFVRAYPVPVESRKG